jgi:GTP-binding protein Era
MEESSFHSGFVSIIGRPNVGKSTLLNRILEEKVAIVTPKPQTTRNRIVGIKNLKNAQIIFIDTPGIHRPREKLGHFMVSEAKESLKDVDIVLHLTEPRLPGERELEILRLLEALKMPGKNTLTARAVFLLINKIDTIKKAEILPVIERYKDLYDYDEIIPISALRGDGVDKLIGKIILSLPLGPKYYPDDQYTDQIERFMVAEIIREKIMNLTEEEIPYSVAVEVVGWEERENLVLINANIYVEKKSQKGIIIGKGGSMLRAIGVSARKDIESLLNSRVYLDLWVKDKEGWKNKAGALRELGYN